MLNLILIINQVHTKMCWQAVISESTSCHLVISLEKENQVHRHLSHFFFSVDLIFPKSRQNKMRIPPNLPFAKSSSSSQCYFCLVSHFYSFMKSWRIEQCQMTPKVTLARPVREYLPIFQNQSLLSLNLNKVQLTNAVCYWGEFYIYLWFGYL